MDDFDLLDSLSRTEEEVNVDLAIPIEGDAEGLVGGPGIADSQENE